MGKGLKENFSTGVFILVLVGIALWFFDTFFAGVDGVVRAGLLRFVPSLAPYLENAKGVGLLVAFAFALPLGALANVKPIQRAAKFLAMRIPLIGRLIGSVLDTLNGLSSLPLVEVAYPSQKHTATAWLRSVRWADRPVLVARRKGRKEHRKRIRRERFLECTVAIPTMNNPTSGWGIKVEPAEIRCVLSNPSTDFVWHILSFTLFNPKWERDRIFDPKEFLNKEFVPQGLQEHLPPQTQPQKKD